MRVPHIILDSPVVLSTAAACTLIYGLSLLHPGVLSCFSWPSWRLSRLSIWLPLQLLSHSLGHADWGHLQHNLMLLSLVGPPCERFYGSSTLMKVLVCCSVAVAISHWLLGPSNAQILGLSGVVFAMMMLNGFSGCRHRSVPATAILTASLWLVAEIGPLLRGRFDGVSHLSHLVGAVVGGYCGYAMGQADQRTGGSRFQQWLSTLGIRKPKAVPASFHSQTQQIGQWLSGKAS
ncbi:unnamed protein product [Cladocopium goreaui]|uniref:Metallophosphoesterase domain-containing protein 1 n=1 Tax=Cladocopium goreaui TaxID=2562237 RepID=A0A9P1D4U6_9DINO|nr:unnamed protein product [Cladocopium goreaui]